ncbi:dynamin family protein [Acinetobacter schindleri]|uniref:dynamin family protein n=1 Tax=Acinetobacter schindleri TaxID=108981 RepID=UPI002FE32747
MSYQEGFDIAQRYDLLCRASQSHVEQDGQRLQLAADLDVLDKIINHDLPELARSGSPDHFADILKSLNLELEHFREFCEFPDLAQKVVVGVGGAFSAGKSSLINTLLGKKRLVVEIDPTTSLPTYLLYGEQEQITALNLFRRRVILSQDEFASLTHEEKIKYGSQIAGLLRSAFVSDLDFTWKNIALLDTPGYSKPDSEQWSERTDESMARSQLNLSNFIIWVVSATQGTISEDDLKFLTTLNADIPKLIVVSRADAKTPEDIAKIVALVKQTTAERGVNVLDVVPVSARKKNDYPIQPVVEFLEKWNEHKKTLSFAQNFKRQFLEYARFIQGQQCIALLKLNRLNRILTLAELVEIQEDAQELQLAAQSDLEAWQKITESLRELQYKFFSKLKNIGNEVGIELPEPDELELLERSGVDIISLLKQVMENLDKTESTKSSTWDALIRPAKVENLDKLLRQIQQNIIFEQLMH